MKGEGGSCWGKGARREEPGGEARESKASVLWTIMAQETKEKFSQKVHRPLGEFSDSWESWQTVNRVALSPVCGIIFVLQLLLVTYPTQCLQSWGKGCNSVKLNAS